LPAFFAFRRARSARSFAVGAVAIALFASQSDAAADPASVPGGEVAVKAIEDLHATLLAVMKNAAQLGFQGRYERLRPTLLAHYDFAFMSEKSVGRSWKDLDAAAREKVVDAFGRLAMATYAARFDGWNGERFEILGTQQATHDTLLVRTRIVRSGEEPVALDYRLHPVTDGDWRIIDVFLNGTVSELALRRAEYSAVLKRDGYDGLLAALEEKISAQERGEGSEPAP
jgi:phospholipid transport system substrate-binding protein